MKINDRMGAVTAAVNLATTPSRLTGLCPSLLWKRDVVVDKTFADKILDDAWV